MANLANPTGAVKRRWTEPNADAVGEERKILNPVVGGSERRQ
jgi:hypothetical protein